MTSITSIPMRRCTLGYMLHRLCCSVTVDASARSIHMFICIYLCVFERCVLHTWLVFDIDCAMDNSFFIFGTHSNRNTFTHEQTQKSAPDERFDDSLRCAHVRMSLERSSRLADGKSIFQPLTSVHTQHTCNVHNTERTNSSGSYAYECRDTHACLRELFLNINVYVHTLFDVWNIGTCVNLLSWVAFDMFVASD